LLKIAHNHLIQDSPVLQTDFYWMFSETGVAENILLRVSSAGN